MRGRSVDGERDVWGKDDGNGLKNHRDRREVHTELNARQTGCTVTLRRPLVTAAARLQCRTIAAVVLLGGANRMIEAVKRRDGRSPEQRCYHGDRRYNLTSRLHNTNAAAGIVPGAEP